MNKYLISVDIEGITGVIGKTFATQGSKNYELARKYMHSDVNAVVQGIAKQDPNSWILVRDAHGDAINLDLDKLHPKAHLIQGWGNALNMLEGLDESFKGVYFVGYHAGGQNNEAVLGHTLSAQVHYLKINDSVVNEAGVNALYAGIFNVPVAFVSGDDHAVCETIAYLPNITSVVVKESLARDSAMSFSLSETRKLLEEAASAATRNLLAGKISPVKIAAPFKAELKLYSTGYKVSILEKLYATLSFDKTYEFVRDEFVIKYSSNSMLELLQRLNLILQLVYFGKGA